MSAGTSCRPTGQTPFACPCHHSVHRPSPIAPIQSSIGTSSQQLSAADRGERGCAAGVANRNRPSSSSVIFVFVSPPALARHCRQPGRGQCCMMWRSIVIVYLCLCCGCGFGFSPSPPTSRVWGSCVPPFRHLNMREDSDGELSSSQFSMEEVPLNQIFRKAVVLQRMGDRLGALDEYQQFLKVAKSHDVHPSLYAEVHANMGAIYAMQGKDTSVNNMSHEQKTATRIKAKEAFQEAVKYRPSLGSAWVNIALILLAEGKDNTSGSDKEQSIVVQKVLKEARQCCERALGMDNEEERSRALANKLISDIDVMLKQVA